MKYVYQVLVLIIVVFTIHWIYDKVMEPKNTITTDVVVPINQNIDTLYIGDSVRAIQQELLLTKDKEVIHSLQDSLQKVINRAASLRPEVIIKYRETYAETHTIGKLEDSLSVIIEDLINKTQETTVTREELLAYKADILSKKIPYKIESKYRYETGKVDYYGNIQSDTLTVISEPVVTVGTKTGFLKRPTYAITIGNKNPYISQSNVSSVIYKPERKLQVSMGPMALTDGKNVSAGLGITLKKGILSASIGYQLVNTQKK